MADQETKDAIQSTALAVVEQQQTIVGGALVGASGSAVLAENTDSQSQILEQIRDIQIQTLRATRDVVNTMKDMFALDKLQDRRAREDATELEKEKDKPLLAGPDEGGDIDPQEADKKAGGIFAFLGGLPGAGLFKKMFAPIMAFFGKGGLLVKLFGKFGPLGALILGFTLLYKYSDEIAAALAPALDKIKVLFDKLQPAIDVLMQIGDFLMKGIIKGIGEVITFLIGTVEKFIDGITKIFEGDIMGGLNDIFEGIVRTILAVPLTIINFLKPLFLDIIDYIAEPWNNMVTNVNQYISDTFTAIKDYFVELKDNIVGFFVDAYETVKTTITNAIQGAFDFIADIFNSISDFMSESYTKAKNFVTQLPDKILTFISNMFSPIIDFFNSIGNRIKMTINGVIDALPLPGFVKDKIKFDVEPSQDQMDAETDKFEKLEAPQTDDNTINAGTSFKLEKGVLQEPGGDGPALYPELESASRVSNILNTATGTEDFSPISTDKGFLVGKADQMIMPEGVTKLEEIESAGNQKNMSDIESVGNTGETIIVNNNDYSQQNQSVANQTDVHSGKLDTGIDSYFDRVAMNARGYGF